jgi:hypothetical protein
MEYFPNFYNICIENFKNTFDQTNMYSFLFFSFGEYAVSSFQIEINHKICTKVRNTSPTFGIKFSNHKLALLEHNFFARSVFCEGIEPQVLSRTLPNVAQVSCPNHTPHTTQLTHKHIIHNQKPPYC